MNKKVAIIGNGWVGRAMKGLFPDALVYVRAKTGDPEAEARLNQVYQAEINKCDIAFICVPTPLGADGKLDTSIVEEVIAWLDVPLIVIRSTVNPGDCQRLEQKYGKKLIFQPEYLGETPNHPLLDETKAPFIILGGDKESTRDLIDLYTTVYNANLKIRQVTLREAEVIKLTENRAIAFKVMQCQELYDACMAAGIDYYTIRDAVYGDDPRFNLYWTFIYPDDRGFNSSKCLVKDVPAWYAWCESLGVEASITKELIDRSNKYAKAGEMNG